MKRPNPIQNEINFGIEDMFFSTTDARGVILDGNDVFVRISKYSRDELIGTPHSIIRHPDMPKVVFKALWDTIAAGKPICAYVKNLAKDGSFYWVFATVIPIGEDYLSIRMKPTTPLKELVEGLYKELLVAEKTGGIEASLKLLITTLNSLGIPDYGSFVVAAISAELANRHELQVQNTNTTYKYEKLENAREAIFNIFNSINKLSSHTKEISEKIAKIREVSKNIEYSALNATIEADRLGEEGRALAVIAQHISIDAAEAKKYNSNINEIASTMLGMFQTSQLSTALSTLELEMLACFISQWTEDESSMNKDAFTKSCEMLTVLIEESLKHARDTIKLLNKDITRLAHELDNTYKTLMTLDFIQKNGSIEAARLEDNSGFSQLFQFILVLIKESKVIYADLSNLINKVIKVELTTASRELLKISKVNLNDL